ncbi:MAG: DUF1475 family protein [Acidobacteriota bacterium]|nr:DUF1475 family protein [Acidobacteriota bacterium]
MRGFVVSVAAAIFAGMLYVTIATSLEQSLWAAWPAYAGNPWAMATFYDAYSGFTLFWLWVAYRERSWAARMLWLIFIYGLGNIATSLYVLIAVVRLPKELPVSAILQRRPA